MRKETKYFIINYTTSDINYIDNICNYLDKEIIKVIVVPNKIVNIVVK